MHRIAPIIENSPEKTITIFLKSGNDVINGKETIKSGDKTYNALHFNFSSTDKKLKKDKKLNTDVWYDEKTLNWVKATFKKKGDWEYKIVTIE